MEADMRAGLGAKPLLLSAWACSINIHLPNTEDPGYVHLLHESHTRYPGHRIQMVAL